MRAAALVFCCGWAWAAWPLCAAQPPDQTAHFEQQIAPLLVRRCLSCHNGSELKGGLDLTQSQTALAGGDSGPALVPGQPAESLLWNRVAAGEMPPEQPLDAAEQELLKTWLSAGAVYSPGRIDPFRFTTDARAGYDWWALQPVAESPPPVVQDGTWPAGEIDRFILAGLEAAGLAPAPAADRRTLIRRLSFDLLGLPPAPEDVAAFVADDSPQAYEHLVDRLLDSPHYGERWARHWLDVVRFGESQGFERDKLRPHAWPYRDWVIAALNADLPYDEFIRLQLAGDILAPDDPSAVAATGFLTAGAYDEVGQTQQSAAMRAVVRQDELEDMVGVTSQTFLGLTIHCARCHDHKFDPVAQREYYQLTAALAGVRHADRERASDAAPSATRDRRQELLRQLAHHGAQLETLLAPVRQRWLAAADDPAKLPAPPTPIARWEFDEDFRDSLGQLHGEPLGTARLADGRLVLDGAGHVATAPLTASLAAKTLEVWLAVADLNQQGGGAISVQSLDGGLFDAIVYAERDVAQWMAGSNSFARTSSFQGPPEMAPASELIHLAITYAEDGTIACYRQGAPYGQPYQAAGVQAFEAAGAQVLFGLRHSPPEGNKQLSAFIDRAQLYDRALSAEEAAASAGVRPQQPSQDNLLAVMTAAERAAFYDLELAASRVQLAERLLAGGVSYVPEAREPETCHLLIRGNPAQPAEVVVPGGVAAVAPGGDFGLAADAPEQDRRRQLAAWISSPDNPLARRVIVNRLWQHHFGQGLVATPNDFGFNGGRPTHPELLDWLAAELLRCGWRLKPLHRHMVLSAAYRQSSRYDAPAAARDADNRLLWRAAPRRLEAEAIRDSVLWAAGELNPRMGGPGYQDFRTFTFNSQFYEIVDRPGREFSRRSIYRTIVRSGANPLLDVLDCPDPSATAPRRAVTTTPLQALSLLNDDFMLRMSRAFAQRLERERPADLAAQIERGVQLAWARGATSQEQAAAAQFIPQHGLWAWCRVLFNSNEFVYVD